MDYVVEEVGGRRNSCLKRDVEFVIRFLKCLISQDGRHISHLLLMIEDDRDSDATQTGSRLGAELTRAEAAKPNNGMGESKKRVILGLEIGVDRDE